MKYISPLVVLLSCVAFVVLLVTHEPPDPPDPPKFHIRDSVCFLGDVPVTIRHRRYSPPNEAYLYSIVAMNSLSDTLTVIEGELGLCEGKGAMHGHN